MGEWGWVMLGWLTAGGVLSLYSASVLLRGRRLSKIVPEDRRRWTN